MIKYQLARLAYRRLVKPFLFGLDPELVHSGITYLGEGLENIGEVTEAIFSYQNKKLGKKVLGVEFPNPVGLAAGFDYDGHLAKTVGEVGFGFNSVGTVTARPYRGNDRPILARLPKSQSLLVNKGFKSEGAEVVAKRLDQKDLEERVVGISVGSSNIAEIDTVAKAIEDYLVTFDIFKKKKYCKYFELNISCPNTAMPEPFGDLNNFQGLVREVAKLRLRQPIFVKMPISKTDKEIMTMLEIISQHCPKGVILGNLQTNRQHPQLHPEEIAEFSTGNFSGKPTF